MRDAWRTRELTPVANRDTTTELLRVLAYPRFALTPGEREDRLAEYLPFAESVRSPDQVSVSSQNRNFPGRSGPGQLYLVSPYSVAASAVAGRVVGWGG